MSIGKWTLSICILTATIANNQLLGGDVVSGKVLPPKGFGMGAGNPKLIITKDRDILARVTCDIRGEFQFDRPADVDSFDIVILSDLFTPLSIRGVVDVQTSISIQLAAPPLHYTNSATVAETVADNVRTALRATEEARSLLPDTAEFRNFLQANKEELIAFRRVRVLIPAYFYPGGPTLQEWNELANFVKQLGGEAVIILNIDSGASPGQIEPNYQTIAAKLAASRIPWIGYVDLSYGRRGQAEIQKDLDHWLRYSGCFGYFFDQTPSSNGDGLKPMLSYANSQLKKARIRTPILIGNTGTQCDESLTGPKMFTGLCVKENLYNSMEFQRPAWHDATSGTSIGAISYGISTDDAFRSEFQRIVSRGADFLYLTDQDGRSEVLWTRLPSKELRALTVSAVSKWNEAMRKNSQQLKKLTK